MDPDGSNRKIIATGLPPSRRRRRRRRGGSRLLDQYGRSEPRTTARSNAPTSTERIAGSSLHPAARSRRSSSISIRRTASSIGPIARGCESCARISTARRSKPSSRPEKAKHDRRDQTRWCVGIAVDPKRGDRSTGRKRAVTTPKSGASCAPGSTFRRARRRSIAATSRSSSTAFPSRSISRSISNIASSTGPTAAIPRAATR